MIHLKSITSRQLLKRNLYGIIILLFLLCFSACIKDDFPDCTTTVMLDIKAVDATGQNITSSGEAGGAHLYVFDGNRKYVEEMTISATDIQNEVPVQVVYRGGDGFWIVVWSNINGSQQVDSLVKGTSMEQALVQLKRNAEGYAVNPDDLFYGVTNIKNENPTANITKDDDIIITRKTALVNITVRGLDAQFANDYYFVITGAKDDAYNFSGNLTGSAIEYKQDGAFNASNRLFISEPFRMYPLSNGNRLTISIYKGDKLIVSADTNNQDGSPIVPIVGVNNNILIDLTASLTVNIEVTNWNDIYHWLEW